MIVQRIGVLSAGKVCGILYALMGLIVGVLFSILSVLGAFASLASDGGDAVWGLFFGAGAVILLPVFYGLMGLICGSIGAALYNLVAKFVGGLEIDLQ